MGVTTGKRYAGTTTADQLQEAAVRSLASQQANATTNLGGAKSTRSSRSGKVLAVGPSTGGRGSAGRPV